jgi:hypothetical protein
MNLESMLFDANQEPSHIHIARPGHSTVALTPHKGVNTGRLATDSYLWSHACLLDYDEDLDGATDATVGVVR